MDETLAFLQKQLLTSVAHSCRTNEKQAVVPYAFFPDCCCCSEIYPGLFILILSRLIPAAATKAKGFTTDRDGDGDGNGDGRVICFLMLPGAAK
jgi:hypothetical protein